MDQGQPELSYVFLASLANTESAFFMDFNLHVNARLCIKSKDRLQIDHVKGLKNSYQRNGNLHETNQKWAVTSNIFEIVPFLLR